MKNIDVTRELIENGGAVLGIELGSTRIKAVLIDAQHAPIASGSFDWANKLVDGIWTYSLEDIETGLQASYASLCAEVEKLYNTQLTTVSAMGVSAMMHGYLAFNEHDALLTPFRTWRNTTTEEAADKLTAEFGFNIPQRWTIAHLYQSMLNGEEHVRKIKHVTTLAGYVHWRLTGKKVLGVGDASGVFPIDSETNYYDKTILDKFNKITEEMGYSFRLEDILPAVLPAGELAGELTSDGAAFLSPSGSIKAGVPLCPPEGDAGTGMTATNSVTTGTGNVSAGTSIFSIAVLERPLSQVYMEIDMVTTPTGKPVAMVHCNNCTADIDAWVKIFASVLESFGVEKSKSELYNMFYEKALAASPDCGGLLSYNYLSGEPITGLEAGRPLFIRTPDADFSLENFARSLIYSSMATLKLGMKILDSENVRLTKLTGHGGLFKAPKTGQQLMASALGVPVAVMSSAGEGGAWGIALLAAYMKTRRNDESLESFLEQQVFAEAEITTAQPNSTDAAGFAAYMEKYELGLSVEKKAVELL